MYLLVILGILCTDLTSGKSHVTFCLKMTAHPLSDTTRSIVVRRVNFFQTELMVEI